RLRQDPAQRHGLSTGTSTTKRERAMHDLELSEDQRMIRDMARDFARREIAPHAQASEKAGWIDDALVAQLGELGLLGMFVAEQSGGSYIHYVAYALAVEETSACDRATRA